jgi:hypothetical protein
MTPLEAMRQLTQVDFADPDTGCCIACDEPPDTLESPDLAHTSACPVGALPRIVAVLEAIERTNNPGGISPSEVMSMRGEGMAYQAIAQHFGTYVGKIRGIVARAERATRRDSVIVAALQGDA